MKKILCYTMCSAILLLSGCGAMQQAYDDDFCNAARAYNTGFSDGYGSQAFRDDFGLACTSDRSGVMTSYRQGYEAGINKKNQTSRAENPGGDDNGIHINIGGHSRGRHHHKYYPNTRANYQCIEAFGNKACGYGCVKSFTDVRCASNPYQRCVTDQFGHIACGYNCVQNQFGVICAQHSSENCAIDGFGHSRCGKNCRVIDAKVQCD